MLFRFGRNPDELPTESQGFEDWIEERANGEVEDDDADYYIHSVFGGDGGVVGHCGIDYRIEFCETDRGHGPEFFSMVYGKMIRVADQTVVAVINAQLLTCDYGGLYDMADDESQELIDFVRYFCNDNRRLRKPLRAAIEDPARIKAAGRGGLLFLDEVHVLRSCRGQDLSITLVNTMLVYLEPRWSLCGTVVYPYGYEDQYDYMLQKHRTERTDAERTRLGRHFARLGLKQLNDEYWFLEASLMPPAPLPREAVADLEVIQPPPEVPPAPEPSELDAKLKVSVELASLNDEYVKYQQPVKTPAQHAADIIDLLKQGANPEGVCAVHTSVASASQVPGNWTTLALDTLVAARVDVNHVDRFYNGVIALHVSVDGQNFQATEALLKYGADALARCKGGFTPLATYTEQATNELQTQLDFATMRDYRGWGNPGTRAADFARKNIPLSLLLQRATEARKRQLVHRTALVKALMYYRPFSADVLRKIDASVDPPPVADYPEATGLLPSGTHVVLGGLVKADLNGEYGDILGTDAQSGRYKVELKGAPWQDDEVTLMVKPENVLPLSRPMQTMAMDMTREEMEEEDAEFEAEFGDEFGEPNDDYDDDDDDDDDDYE
jgi:hypothetical protein